MAQKKPVRKASTKKPLKAKTVSKKKTVIKKGKTKPAPKPTATKKKTKPASGAKGTGVAKKPKKVVKPLAKKKNPANATSGKKKAVAKKSVSKKKKAIPKKVLVKSVSKTKPKATAKKKPVVRKKKTPSVTNKATSTLTKKPLQKSATLSAPAVQRVPKSKEPLLSSTERYNIGGLFACAIERRHDPDFLRLRAVLRHLDLSSQEEGNLIRLSEGFMIPKLFAENLAEQKVNQLLADLVKFGLTQGSYEEHWREDIQQIGFWLGIFPAQFQAIEHQVKR